jgi:hypothetical protein
MLESGLIMGAMVLAAIGLLFRIASGRGAL